jgi:putative chitinase
VLSATQLLVIMPNAGTRVEAFCQPLADAMAEFEITTSRRVCAFIANVAEESGELRFLEELADGLAYEGRADLGNTQPGDGPRYKGRGLLQATGRAQYTTIGKALGLDLVNNPDLLKSPIEAARSAAWIWSIEKKLNPLADLDAFGTICHRVNGGFNGLDARLKYWLRGRKIEGL